MRSGKPCLALMDSSEMGKNAALVSKNQVKTCIGVNLARTVDKDLEDLKMFRVIFLMESFRNRFWLENHTRVWEITLLLHLKMEINICTRNLLTV